MSIEIIYENGKITTINHLNRRYEPVILTDLEREATDIIIDIISKSSINQDFLTLERRTDKYLSYILPEDYDFLRIKVTNRTKWFSIDAWKTFDTTLDDTRFDCVENRNIRHWKFKLNNINDLYSFSDLIISAAQKKIN